ncbi:hypothetical protein BH11VER1_BH11VER1_22600 [soil metagenome]
MRRFALCFLMAGLFLSIGLQWACLQTAAWVGMVVRYSQAVSLYKAVEMTFDGEHPCKLCKAVKSGQENQTKQGINPTMQKFNLIITKVERIYFEHGSMRVEDGLVCVPPGRHTPPPTPPPRVG